MPTLSIAALSSAGPGASAGRPPSAAPAISLAQCLPGARAAVDRRRRDAPGALAPAEHRALTATVLALHLAGVWALLQVEPVRRSIVEMAPAIVRLLPPPAETPQPTAPDLPRPSRAAPVPPAAAVPVPAVELPVPTAAPRPVVAVTPEPSAAPAPVVVATATPTASPVAATPAPAPASASAPAPAAPPVPAAPKTLAATAARYLVEPRIEMPLLSRRAREQGVVMLRVVVDTGGRPKEVSVRRSSGFPRLDDAALDGMRSARFVPYTENGRAIEWQMVAPVAFELED